VTQEYDSSTRQISFWRFPHQLGKLSDHVARFSEPKASSQLKTLAASRLGVVDLGSRYGKLRGHRITRFSTLYRVENGSVKTPFFGSPYDAANFLRCQPAGQAFFENCEKYFGSVLRRAGCETVRNLAAKRNGFEFVSVGSVESLRPSVFVSRAARLFWVVTSFVIPRFFASWNQQRLTPCWKGLKKNVLPRGNENFLLARCRPRCLK
jgi:hypothetical protein